MDEINKNKIRKVIWFEYISLKQEFGFLIKIQKHNT